MQPLGVAPPGVPPQAIQHGWAYPYPGFPHQVPGAWPGGVPLPQQPGMMMAQQSQPQQPVEKKNIIQVKGNAGTANIDQHLISNIKESNFYKTLFEFRTVEDLMDKAEASVKYINAWGDQAHTTKRGSHLVVAPQQGTAHLAGMRGWIHQHHQASPCWCILYKLAQLKPTKPQVSEMLQSQNAYIRCIALIYLRLVMDPEEIWGWYEDMLEDGEQLVMCDKPHLRHTTVRDTAAGLLKDLKFLDTRFPRINEKVMKDIREKLKDYGIDAGASDGIAKPEGRPERASQRDDRDRDDMRLPRRPKEEKERDTKDRDRERDRERKVQVQDRDREREQRDKDKGNRDRDRDDKRDDRSHRDSRDNRDDRRGGRDDRSRDSRRDDRRDDRNNNRRQRTPTPEKDDMETQKKKAKYDATTTAYNKLKTLFGS